MGIASLVFGIISIVVGLIAFGIQFLGIVENLFYLTIVGMGSGIGLFIVGGLLFQKYNNDRKKEKTESADDSGSAHLNLARESLRDLIEDTRLPPGIRDSLAHDYEAVQAMLDKLQHGHLHIAVFGRVSTGKSSSGWTAYSASRASQPSAASRSMASAPG